MNTPSPSKAPTVFEDFNAATTSEPCTDREAIPRDAAKALEGLEDSYRYLFEANPHPMWICDCETLPMPSPLWRHHQTILPEPAPKRRNL